MPYLGEAFIVGLLVVLSLLAPRLGAMGDALGGMLGLTDEARARRRERGSQG